MSISVPVKISDLPLAVDVVGTELIEIIQNGDNKKIAISHLSAIAGGSYVKPTNGIPSTDFTTAVQTSLNKADTAVQPTSIGSAATHSSVDFASAAQGAKADTAYQKPSNGIPSSDLTTAIQTTLALANTALQSLPVIHINDITDAGNVGRTLLQANTAAAALTVLGSSSLVTDVAALNAKNDSITATTDPISAPTRVGQRYQNTATKALFIANGTASVSDWIREVTYDSAGRIPANALGNSLTLTTTLQTISYPNLNIKATLVSGTGTTIVNIVDQNAAVLGTFSLDTVGTVASGLLTDLAGQLAYVVISGTGVFNIVASINV